MAHPRPVVATWNFRPLDGREMRQAQRQGRTRKMCMKTTNSDRSTGGKVGWALLWLIGVPVPVLLIFFLLRGCT